jgi:hypothetical protein
VWPRWITDPLSGKTSLARAFWLYGLGGSIAYSTVALLFPETRAGLTISVMLGLALGILQSVILWRCAPNAQSAFLGRFVRASVAFGLILVPFMLYLLFSSLDALLPPNNRWSGP